ncbi:glycosyltransferase family 1 protein [Faecalicatena orotica]|uniref:Glycosyltransferase involved in cell wall biosynthesis n=1 Tax=Faecalicatena orotica TaxID=1544 RepID=A0A2Y9BKE5_9FIRM|nr:glycosyltransferase family 1 protein [Faecalicatena orotica]PWJ20725.1 glycosyltransferase involved in cell wall biosynthesis [Faecalicatena orotica]SSA58524.1 Glycosyltransferase involved in cell wall bisynthesis [Faecalicatena orotica]
MKNKIQMKTDEEAIRVAHIVGKMVGGGLESTVLNYYRYIDRSAIQYDFLIDEDSTYIPEEIEQLGGHIILIPPYQNLYSYQKKLYKILKENKYPLVYSHINTLSVFPMFAAWRANIPIRVVHNHSTAGKGEWKKNLIKYSLRPLSKIFPTTLCACSNFAGEWIFGKRTMDSGKVTIWQNAVEIDKFLFNKERRDITRCALGVNDRFVIAHVGRFIHQKNHGFIIDIFNEIYKKNSNAILLLVGNGALMPIIKEKVHALELDDVVIFTGNRNDIEDIYQAMDVFIMPSFYEGLGMVAVEAQISGLPVICANTIPIEAKICENMKYYSLKDSATKWAEEILQYADGFERKNMKNEAVASGYDINTAAKKMTLWYKKLLSLKAGEI